MDTETDFGRTPSTPGECSRTTRLQEATEEILGVLNEYPAEIWGDVLGTVVAPLFQSKLDAARISEEDRAIMGLRQGGPKHELF